MKQFPSIPRAANAPDGLFDSGHLWLLEKVDGANFRFQLRQSGQLRFGDRSRIYETADAVPDPYQHAVRHVRAELDRHALREAVEDVETVVFFGEAMHQHAIDYDWERTPSVLGFDVWSATEEGFLPPDTVEQIFERLGLQPVNAVERERNARDFHPESYTIPQSAWYDGPAEGVVVRNKQGQRAKLLHPNFREVDDTVPVDGSASELAERYATRRRVEKLATKFEDSEQTVTFQTLYEQVLEDIVREEHKQLYHGEQSVDMSEFRSEVAARTRAFLDEFERDQGGTDA
ncbi:RNA ligase [Halorientalis persicus]|uniref:RNA ligase n=1 Tax=Halorientalis persicus TaxID=1367881 RepID=A0A1H8QK98_9EURY|nr:RNA ligase family protein [Halorientalis persicus]SEO54357.1 RNA ligase [Halorientalis persicus]